MLSYQAGYCCYQHAVHLRTTFIVVCACACACVLACICVRASVRACVHILCDILFERACMYYSCIGAHVSILGNVITYAHITNGACSYYHVSM